MENTIKILPIINHYTMLRSKDKLFLLGNFPRLAHCNLYYISLIYTIAGHFCEEDLSRGRGGKRGRIEHAVLLLIILNYDIIERN